MISASSMSVLLVDDQTSIRSLLRNSLVQLGFVHVAGVRNGIEALEHLKANPTHLIISDFNMPDMDGLELLKAVRASSQNAKTGFIMLTGQASKELVQQAISSGVNNFLAKPFTTSSLKARIEAVFGPICGA
ncbi:response regulator [Gluconobacter japonicus]|uniref:Response regulator n=1 Tax=Gluconobacter japonicus TaxID=376620 RepID=A0A149SDU8_GLUJA|nr:response regulator [Gluconobacter japonicus]KXV21620.1 chemotaxis protein CheY [Gluconobacter japonicus]KXV25530.1 chemotaxis protein CheY [Gluconobacter japonicus]KXV28495.1 chemotaxis protein CheY [Gluconobacter japonicus]KXV39035.1 chemotaxis protein CheY [Gluconobacter japonicus]MBF0869438.1 response regulator [Gluconobacter japonicus]